MRNIEIMVVGHAQDDVIENLGTLLLFEDLFSSSSGLTMLFDNLTELFSLADL